MPTTAVTRPAAGNGDEHRQVEGGRRRWPRIGADAEEGAVAEGDLAGEADQDVETDRGDGRNPDHIEDIEHIGTGQQRHEGKQEHQTDPGPETAEIGRRRP